MAPGTEKSVPGGPVYHMLQESLLADVTSNALPQGRCQSFHERGEDRGPKTALQGRPDTREGAPVRGRRGSRIGTAPIDSLMHTAARARGRSRLFPSPGEVGSGVTEQSRGAPFVRMRGRAPFE